MKTSPLARFFRVAFASLLAIAMFGVPTTARAASIAVDFSGDGPEVADWRLESTETAGTLAQTRWNHVSTVGASDDVAAARGISGPLMDAAGQMTRVRLQFSGNDAWYTEGGTDTANARMMKGTLKQAGSPGPLSLTFTNLAEGLYDVYVYGNVDQGPVEVDISVGSSTNYWLQPASFDDGVGFYEANGTDPGARAEGNYVKFTAVPAVNGTVTVLAFYRGGGNGVGISGVQLVSSSAFPPLSGPTQLGAAVQITNQTRYVGSPVSFYFVATNNATDPIPMVYTWYRNDQPVAGITGERYSFLTGSDDSNALIYVRATMPAEYNPANLLIYSATGQVSTLEAIVRTNGLKLEHFPGAIREQVAIGDIGPAASISVIPGFELPVNDNQNNFTRRVSGYFIPPVSGVYVFFLSADDDADLFLGTNENPSSRRLIAQEENWSGSRSWTSSGGNSSLSQKRSDQWSPDGVAVPYASGIELTAGQRYWIEGLQHQGAGGDNFAVTYKLLADPDPVDGDAPLLHSTNRNVAYATSPVTSLTWSQQPTNMTTAAGQLVTLAAQAVSDGELSVMYQWHRNDQPVTNATGANYSFLPLLTDNNSRWYVTALAGDGGLSITSSVVTVQVTANDRFTLTFTDQVGNDVPADPNPYTEEHGLPAGVTVTFFGFSNWNGSDDHTPTDDDYLLYGDNYDEGGISTLTFGVPVEVPSFWAATQGGGRPGVATIRGFLGDTEQFSLVLTLPGFVEVTNGAGKLIDSMQFIDYGDSWIDDMIVVKPTVLTFSDQVGNDVPANPAVYGENQGLPAGVTVTFQGFSNWNGSQDHTPTMDNYLLYGSNYEPGSTSTVTFNRPVYVPSMWVSTEGGGQSGTATIRGLLNGQEQFTYTINASGFVEVVAGAGRPIDTLRFTDYGDAWLDDVTILRAADAPPPAPPLLTFSDQVGNDVPADPSVYTDAHGLPTGVTATFDGFNNWNGSEDHTATGDNYLLYGARYEPGEVSTITFNKPVELASFWVSAEGGGQPGTATIRGYLGNVEQFQHVVADGGFAEVTAGVGKPVDSLRFTDYGDSWIDDMLIRLPGSEARLTLAREANGSLSLSWKGSGTLVQSPNLTSWTDAPSQANPQVVTPSGNAMFYRLEQ